MKISVRKRGVHFFQWKARRMEKGSSEKPIVVYGAIAANLVIAVVKYVVAFITGSSAMLSEGIHSTADTGNELLLLLGLHQSQKPADKQHPFGHGQELYFWGLIVAIILFSAGGGMSIYEGITHLTNPTEMQSPIWNYIVLGVAFVIEAISLYIAIKEFLHRKEPGESIWQSLSTSKDPSIFIVIGENAAAMAGLVVAFLGVFLSHRLHSFYPDGIASIVIGIILGMVAIYLAYHSKSLLVGETADQRVVEGIQELVAENPEIRMSRTPLTMQLSPDEILLNLEIRFRSHQQNPELIKLIDELEGKIKKKYPAIRQIFIEAEGLKGAGKDPRSGQDSA